MAETAQERLKRAHDWLNREHDNMVAAARRLRLMAPATCFTREESGEMIQASHEATNIGDRLYELIENINRQLEALKR